MTQPAQTTQKPPSIRDYLESDYFKEQVGRSLPETMSAAAFVQSAVTAVIRNRKLLDCTRESLFKCLMDLSAMGLTPDGRRAHLIPFGQLCTLIIDYKGIAECVRRNGDVATIHCDVIGRNDHFLCSYGSGSKLEHIPNIENRGKIWAVYSFVRLKGGYEEWDVMSLGEVEAVRERSRSKDNGPWITDWNEMAKKTVFRRHSKTLPLSPDSRKAVEYGEEEEFGFKNAVPARVPAKKGLMPYDLLSPEGQLNTSQTPQQAAGSPEPSISTTEVPKPPKAAKKSRGAPEPAAKSAGEATGQVPAPKKASEHELFTDQEVAGDADRLIMALRRDKISWESFFWWIASTGALGQDVTEVLPVSFLKPDLLADCVSHYDANIEAFRHWEATTPEK